MLCKNYQYPACVTTKQPSTAGQSEAYITNT